MTLKDRWLLTRYSWGYRKIPPEFMLLAQRHWLDDLDPKTQTYRPHAIAA
jgi:hypothetical protein